MGALTSRQNAAVEEADISTNHAYKYPPRSGNYFGCHFIMGGERFDTPQPEAYLFGENADLNFLGSRPAPFPYPPPQANELTKTLKSLVNIRKESVRFVKAPDSATKIHGSGQGNKGNSFNIEFTFDSDAKCAITLYYFCTEEISSTGIAYNPRDSSLTSETFHYEKGVNQLFSQNSHIFNPNLFPEEDLAYNTEKDIFPVAIHCVVEEGIEEARQSHTTICVIDRHTDGTFALRALKQKIFIDGLCYLLQEIYGIENKTINRTLNEDETEDSGSECVICMCDTRDTLILPCRHLCLCNSCADSLRYQANNCPICRAPFRALLQIRAVQKASTNTIHGLIPLSPQDGNNDNIPEGYVAVSLIEALNGPISSIRPTAPIENESNIDAADAVQVPEIVSRNNDKNGKQSPKDIHKMGCKDKVAQNTPEFRMSVLLSKEEGGVTKELLNKHSPLMTRQHSNRDKISRDKVSMRPTSITQRDCVKVINEKNLANSMANTDSQDNDDDSENEKLSPLLNSKMTLSPTKEMISSKALHIDGVIDSIDDTDTDIDDLEAALHSNGKTEPPGDLKFNLNLIKEPDNIVILAGAEDSDYYTPEDPHTTILTQLFNEETKSDKKTEQKSHISSPLAAIKENTTSLPGYMILRRSGRGDHSLMGFVLQPRDKNSPISGNSASTRSSGDSYSSSSSTRQLLATIVNDSTSNTDTLDKQKIMNNCIDNIVNV